MQAQSIFIWVHLESETRKLFSTIVDGIFETQQQTPRSPQVDFTAQHLRLCVNFFI